MTSYALFQVSSSPLKPTSSPAPLRRICPSPEKKRPHSSAVILRLGDSPTSEDVNIADGSTRNRRLLTSKFEFELGKDAVPAAVLKARRIELSFPMVVDGAARGPTTKEEWTELTSIFPTTTEAWVGSPYILFRVQELPPQPWPFTIGRLPLHITTDENEGDPMDRGKQIISKSKAMLDYDLRQRNSLTSEVFSRMLAFFKSLDVVVHEIMSFDGWLRIVVADDTNMGALPRRIANQAAFYKLRSEEPNPDPSALYAQTSDGVVKDNSNYLVQGNKTLRPGVMVSSSLLPDGQWKSTTSGILVVDKFGNPFITVATHGFNIDDEVWHPDPNGAMIGKIVRTIKHADISLVQLAQGLRYVNQTFGTSDEPDGIITKDLASESSLRSYDNIGMNNPFSGHSDGQILATGIKVEDSGVMIKHEWILMDSGMDRGMDPVDGSCGSPILDDNRQVVGLFRYKQKNSQHCYAVSATELRAAEYEICEQEIEF